MAIRFRSWPARTPLLQWRHGPTADPARSFRRGSGRSRPLSRRRSYQQQPRALHAHALTPVIQTRLLHGGSQEQSFEPALCVVSHGSDASDGAWHRTQGAPIIGKSTGVSEVRRMADSTHGIAPAGFRLSPSVTLGPVRLQVADLPRSLGWYRRVLGGRVLDQRPGLAILSAEDGARPLVELHEHPGATQVPRRGRLGLY